MLCERGRRRRRGFRVHQVRRVGALHVVRPSERRLEIDRIRPVERHAGGWTVDARAAKRWNHRFRRNCHEPVADEHLHLHVLRRERQRGPRSERDGPHAGADQHPLPRRQLLEFQQHGPLGQRRLQRGIPAVQLVRDRDRLDPLPSTPPPARKSGSTRT